MGATNPADAAVGTIRKLFAGSIEANSVHGSDSDENAAIEIGAFSQTAILVSKLVLSPNRKKSEAVSACLFYLMIKTSSGLNGEICHQCNVIAIATMAYFVKLHKAFIKGRIRFRAYQTYLYSCSLPPTG